MVDFSSPQDAELINIKISKGIGKSLDITDLCGEFNIYEELGQPVLLADIGIADSVGLLSSFPITGQETLTCTLQKGEIMYDMTWKVIDVVGIEAVGQQSYTYTLDLVEGAYFNNLTSLVSQAYEGNITDIIDSIYTDYLKTELNYKDDSIGKYKCVIPNWSPYRTIKWLMSRAKDKNNKPLVVTNTFKNGTSILSFDTIFSRQIMEEFTYHKQSAQDGKLYNYQDIAQTPLAFNNVTNGQVTHQLKNGAFGSTYMSIDTTNKSADTFEFDVLEYYDDMPKLQKNIVLDAENKWNDKPLNEYSKTVQSVKFQSGENFGPSHLNYEGNTNNFLPFFNNMNRMLESFKYNLVVNGRNDIEVGSLITLKFPSNRPFNEEDPESGLDKKRSGTFLVTKCRHKIDDRDKYTLVIEAVSDGLGEEYNA
jgi:hypothetical protein